MDRRRGAGRRQRPTRWWDSLLGQRRRRSGRRRGESRNIYVDLYHAHDLIVVMVVFLLNVLDAILTLFHLAGGGAEANPIMASLIDRSPALFLMEKILVIGLCLLVVVIHKNFEVARRGAYALLILYGLLAVRHMTI